MRIHRQSAYQIPIHFDLTVVFHRSSHHIVFLRFEPQLQVSYIIYKYRLVVSDLVRLHELQRGLELRVITRLANLL